MTPYAFLLLKWHVCNICGIGKGIKLKLPENIEGEVEYNQNTMMIIPVVKRHTCNISGSANTIWLKLSGYVELNQKILCT